MNDLILNFPYTYSELCHILGEEEKRGTSFYNQQRAWKNKMNFHCIGNTKSRRFIVTKILPPIIVLYEVEGKLFTSREEAEEYRRMESVNND